MGGYLLVVCCLGLVYYDWFVCGVKVGFGFILDVGLTCFVN